MLDTLPRPKVNGIDLDGLDATIAAIRTDRSAGQVRFRVGTDWKGQTRSETNVVSFSLGGEKAQRNFTILADEPMELLGSNAAPNPQELLMGAVNACMIVGYVVQAARRGIALEECRIETDAELDLCGFLGLDESAPMGFRRINYVVTLKGDGTRAQMEEIHQAVMAGSPNHFNLCQPVQMCGRLA